MTRSNVRSDFHVVISVFINSILALFNSAFVAHSFSIDSDTSMPVICAFGLFANRHSDIPPVPMPTSSTVLTPAGANAASHTASDVGL